MKNGKGLRSLAEEGHLAQKQQFTYMDPDPSPIPHKWMHKVAFKGLMWIRAISLLLEMRYNEHSNGYSQLLFYLLTALMVELPGGRFS